MSILSEDFNPCIPMSELYENVSVVFGETQNMRNPALERIIVDRFYKADFARFDEDFITDEMKALVETREPIKAMRIYKSPHPIAPEIIMFEVYAWHDVGEPGLFLFTILAKLKKEPE